MRQKIDMAHTASGGSSAATLRQIVRSDCVNFTIWLHNMCSIPLPKPQGIGISIYRRPQSTHSARYARSMRFDSFLPMPPSAAIALRKRRWERSRPR